MIDKNSIKAMLQSFVLISIFVSFVILDFYNANGSYKAQDYLEKESSLNLGKENSKFIN